MSRSLNRFLAPGALALALLAAAAPAEAAEDANTPKAYVVIFDFAGPGNDGAALADSCRLRLRRRAEHTPPPHDFVLDRLSTQELTGPLEPDVDREKLKALMLGRAGCNVGMVGRLERDGKTYTAQVACLDLTDANTPRGWRKTFTDGSERWRAVLARQIVATYTGAKPWVPPQYGDEKEPTQEQLGQPVNVNGSFDAGQKGWDRPDNLSTFLEEGPKGRGTILRVRTDLARDPWLAYRKALRLGKADPNDPPTVRRDTSYASVAGLEGVHFRSDWIDARRGWRYWLTVDAAQPGGKVFVKGFIDWTARADGLPESALAELGLSPLEFASLSKEKRRKLIAEDARKNPERHRRESYRWYLNTAGGPAKWHHYAAPFPPRGGLPENVQWLSIQIYSYWPPGTYLWDNCFLYEHPGVDAPVSEEQGRTKNLDRSRRETTATAPAETD